MSDKKYEIYHNDLKYKKNRELDSSKIDWNDHLKYLFENIDLDSLDYRLYECKRTNMCNLDLTNMDLIEFPKLPDEYREKIKCLFISENDLVYIPDLTSFRNLEILEISNNNINSIEALPPSLLELTCRFNKLSKLPDCPNIIRIDCSNNEISEIPNYSSLKSLVCANNKISQINTSQNMEKLICSGNTINYIGNLPKIKYLDCSDNKIIKLEDYKNLHDLICNNNNMSDVIAYDQLKYLEIFGTGITVIPFMNNLKELLCEKTSHITISKKYISERKIESKVHKQRMLHIFFHKKI